MTDFPGWSINARSPQWERDAWWENLRYEVERDRTPIVSADPREFTADEPSIRCAAERAAAEVNRAFTSAAERYKTMEYALMAVQYVCRQWEVDLPESLSGEAAEIVNKSLDPVWWRRQLRKVAMRRVEHAAIRAGVVGKGKQPYLSDESVLRQHKRNIANRKSLESTLMRNDQGDEFTMAALADKGMGNKEKRRGELMTRIRGFEEVAQLLNHAALFWTITCPSKFHSVGGMNPKYNGATPRDAQRYLCKVWARIRAELDREGIRPYGFRVAEPHTDGCPHWHMLFFVERKDVQRMAEIVYSYAMEEDGEEAGAKENRVKLVNIEHGNGGSAAAYIAKYISKNIDGFEVGQHKAIEHGEEFIVEGGKVGATKGFKGFDITPAMRVSYWAQVWGIRQFQQIGGVPVGIWREMRRVPEDAIAGAPEGVRKAWDAVQAVKSEDPAIAKQADFGAFILALGGVRTGRDTLIKIATEKVTVEGKYSSYGAKKPIGVYSVEHADPETGEYTIYKSVRYTWERIQGGGDRVPVVFGVPRTGVNNCTDGEATQERIRFEMAGEEAKKIKIPLPAVVDWRGIRQGAKEIEKNTFKFAWRRNRHGR